MPLTLAGATLASGAIGGLSSLVGNIFGSNSQKKANETNMKINQMNNEFNERMMDKQIAYEKEMWSANNEYNSAASQAERWREAGMNPSMMMGNANAGMASSGSVSAASAASPAQVQAYKPDVTGFTDAIASMMKATMDAKQADANVNLMNSQSDVLRAKAAQEIEGMKIDNSWKERMHQQAYDYTWSQIGYNRAMEDYQFALKDYQMMVNEKVPAELAARISLIQAQTGEAQFKSKAALDDIIKAFEKETGIKVNSGIRGIIYTIASFSK